MTGLRKLIQASATAVAILGVFFSLNVSTAKAEVLQTEVQPVQFFSSLGAEEYTRYWVRLDLEKMVLTLQIARAKSCGDGQFCAKVVQSKKIDLPVVQIAEDECGVMTYSAADVFQGNKLVGKPVKPGRSDILDSIDQSKIDFRPEISKSMTLSDTRNDRCHPAETGDQAQATHLSYKEERRPVDGQDETASPIYTEFVGEGLNPAL